MRKIAYFVLIILANNINAQEFNGGIYGSIVASQVDGDFYSGYNKLGFGIGGYVNRFVHNKIALQLALRYIQKGSYKKSDAVYYQCNLQYAEIPLSVRYFHWEKIDIEAGVSIGYLIKAKEKRDGYEIINAPLFNKTELSSIVGVNYDASKRINIGCHFMYSLLFVRPHSKNYNSMKSGQHNNLLMFTLAYKLSDNRK